MKAGKIWGETAVLIASPQIEVHQLKISPHSQCSMHKHEHKWNAFYVTKGVLYLEVERLSYALTDTTRLGVGEFGAVPPGEFHRFVTKDEGAEGIEIYYPPVLAEDIVRRDVGKKD